VREAPIRTVVHFTDAAAFGGAEQMILNLLAGLDRRRWRPILLHHGDPGASELPTRAGNLDVECIEIPRRTPRRSIARRLRRMRPAIFHAHLNWPFACSRALVAAALARTPGVVATQQLYVPIRSCRGVLRHKILSAAVDRYIAVSHHMAGMLRRACLFSERKIRVVHNGVPLPRFEPDSRPSLREALGARNGRPVVLTLARLDRQKGIGYLIEAAAQVPAALFVVAGEGPEREALQDKARTCGVADRVLFLGYRTDVLALLASCDAFALPSLYEGLPLSVLEAMAASKPVIATRVGGTDEAVEDGVTGLLVPPADATALASAIRRLLEQRPLAIRLAGAARESVQRDFSAELAAARTMRIYEELVA
jgi:glycosyltransferase involved in cell wall biosynthesis